MKTISLSSNYNYVSGYGVILEALLTKLPFNIIPRSYGSISPQFLSYFDNIVPFGSDIPDLTLMNISSGIPRNPKIVTIPLALLVLTVQITKLCYHYYL